MGQQVVTLMYGISSNTRGLLKNGDYFWEDFSEGVPESKRYDHDKAPRAAYEGGVLGYPIASGPGMDEDKGEAFLGTTMRIADIEKKHAGRIAKARKKWLAFATWAAKEHGKALPEPELWLTTDERA